MSTLSGHTDQGRGDHADAGPTGRSHRDHTHAGPTGHDDTGHADHTAPSRKPGPGQARSLAPDLARGTMLLLIALAHAHMYLYGHGTLFRGYSTDGGTVDRVVAGLQVLLVDGRALPMFAALFGYGLVRLADRRAASGADWPQVRGLLRRRSRWLIVFGFVHALLLFFGDILATYGLLGLVLVGMLRARDRTLLLVAGLWTLVFALVSVVPPFGVIESGPTPLPTSAESPLAAIAPRVGTWAALTPMLALDVVTPLLLGIWAARRRLLDEPGRHRRLLTRVALGGIGLAVLGGTPLALIDARVWTDWTAATAVPAYVLHSLTGIGAGLGYAALAGLVAHRLSAARGVPGRVATALAACGQRSLTCYLLQSVAFVAVFSPWAGGLGGRLGDAGASAVAATVWLGTVLLAELMRRSGRRGPAEVLLRRLSYRKTPLAAAGQSGTAAGR
ncbi:DUF418 domain-containing protein [Plantactinospora endophytica]|uniref:DUF418 domain-containing protein n=1 Tax=Plantactinospora endophytica TaxID=673535 RepID=A0ABQ4DW72_9ACTN|nr:DUF418 domain-containing protein [Plantactinospora endophytica]GIG86311.1 hypothetical protein Pen02_12470 [Plantactinospora endophytica]